MLHPADPITVLHVPGDHDYVAHLGDDRVTGVEVVSARDDDGTDDPAGRGGGWRPPPALDAAWVTANAGRFDVLHLHFGFEGRTPGQLRDLVAAVHDTGRALVLTVHDLQNPHLADQAGYLALLDVLVPAADEVVTLTPGAAAEIAGRWGREVAVVPHPHIAPLDEVGLARPPRDGGGAQTGARVVGLHLKGLRANLVALPVLRSLVGAVGRLQGVVLRVDVHDEALDPGFPRHDAELVRWLHEAEAAGALDLRVHGRFDDAELRAYLRELDVSVLAYGHGTHSGWLELCHDLGVPVVAGRVGHLGEQQALVEVDLLDPAALAAGLGRALAGYPGVAATAAERRGQRHDVALAHREVYRRAVGATRTATRPATREAARTAARAGAVTA